MNTKIDDYNSRYANEVESLKNERDIGKTVVENARNRYAAEIGDKSQVARMLAVASEKPKKYKIPKKIKGNKKRKRILERIKDLFGLKRDENENR